MPSSARSLMVQARSPLRRAQPHTVREQQAADKGSGRAWRGGYCARGQPQATHFSRDRA
jgi:hypothetical protein